MADLKVQPMTTAGVLCALVCCSNRWCLWGLLGNNPEVSDWPLEPPDRSCLSNHLLPSVHFSALHLFWDELILMWMVLSQTARCCANVVLLLLHFVPTAGKSVSWPITGLTEILPTEPVMHTMLHLHTHMHNCRMQDGRMCGSVMWLWLAHTISATVRLSLCV